MIRIKEKLKAIYHIIFDDEYIVFTVTVNNESIKASAALISDNASKIFKQTAIEVIRRNIKTR